MLLTLMWRRRRRLIVSGEGQEEAVINAPISASSVKHSAVNLTDDAASLPLLPLPPASPIGTRYRSQQDASLAGAFPGLIL